MKKKIIILLSVVIILLMGIVVWFNIPLDLMDLDPNEVMEIVVFNGNSGNATHITDKEQIQHIVENLNGVEVKRSKPSLGYMGYSFKLLFICLMATRQAIGIILLSIQMIQLEKIHFSILLQREILIAAILKVS